MPLRGAKLVLAMGALPPVTLIHNSFPEMTARQPEAIENAATGPSADAHPRVGERFSGHFITAVVARVHRDNFKHRDTKKPIDFANLEVGAFYVAGTALGDDKRPDFGKQFHIQLTALVDKNPTRNSSKASAYVMVTKFYVAIKNTWRVHVLKRSGKDRGTSIHSTCTHARVLDGLG